MVGMVIGVALGVVLAHVLINFLPLPKSRGVV
jgi:tetrahydromethanopterin S-methyltransferase subunit F